MQGSIKKRVGTSGKVSWQVVFDLPPDPTTGKRRQKRITVTTKHEADALAARSITAIETGGYAEADASHMTVEQYMSKWLVQIAQTVKPMSHRRYSDLVRLHIVPLLNQFQNETHTGPCTKHVDFTLVSV